jgi:hypothetical protein
LRGPQRAGASRRWGREQEFGGRPALIALRVLDLSPGAPLDCLIGADNLEYRVLRPDYYTRCGSRGVSSQNDALAAGIGHTHELGWFGRRYRNCLNFRLWGGVGVNCRKRRWSSAGVRTVGTRGEA